MADKKQVTRLLKTARGQIDGILKMVEEDRYCIDISHQIMASEAILKRANKEVLKAHMTHCVHDAVNSKDCDQKIEEMIKVLGYVLERRFNIGEKLEDVRVERRPHQYLYMEGADYIFMNQETFDQIPIAHDLINGVDFLLEGMVVDVVSDASTETVLFADVPVKVQMKITYTEPGLKGDTATNTLKPATVESGAIVRVPLFINEGETIEIDTRDGSYVGRVKA